MVRLDAYKQAFEVVSESTRKTNSSALFQIMVMDIIIRLCCRVSLLHIKPSLKMRNLYANPITSMSGLEVKRNFRTMLI